MYVSLEYLQKQFLDAIGRYSRLTPKDIRKVLAINEDQLRRDRQAGLIEPLSRTERIPHYDVAEIHGYMVTKGMIQVSTAALH